MTTELKAAAFLAGLNGAVTRRDRDIVGSSDNPASVALKDARSDIVPNPRNERVKREYFSYLRGARGHDASTVDKVEKAVSRFEHQNGCKDFRTFNRQQATAFKESLLTVASPRTGKVISLATAYALLGHIERFFDWLSTQKGYRSCVRPADVDYLSLSTKSSCVATARRERDPPTPEQILAALEKAPRECLLDQRDRALMAFILLTGARDGAVVGLKLKHVDLSRNRVFQDAREVATKNSKTITTWFFPVGEGVREIVEEWIGVLTRDLNRGPDDFLFPAANTVFNSMSGKFEGGTLSDRACAAADLARKAFRRIFAAADLPYFNPHSFRNTLVLLGLRLSRNAEEMKAWSQNLGHESMTTTLASYGTIPLYRQEQIFRAFFESGSRETCVDPDAIDLLQRVGRFLEANNAKATGRH
jgi:integrase